MARNPAIPLEIKEKVQQIVEQFNKKNKTHFKIEFRGKHGYLSKSAAPFFSNKKGENEVFMSFAKALLGKPEVTKLGRITWKGDIEKWEFAVFRYSKEFYDPDEWMFPGAAHLNGTIEGTLKAGIEIYP